MTEEEKTHIQKSASFGVELFNKLQRKEINQEEFNKELAYWSLHETFESAEYIPVPKPTDIMKEYYELSFEARKKVKREFFNEVEVASYIEKKNKIIADNGSVMRGLEDLLGQLPDTDTVNKERVKEKLDKFKALQKADEILFHPYYGNGNGINKDAPAPQKERTEPVEWEE